ncbi:hypothetical protein AGOR_G00040600 [Albula goreensis]|uniref:Uncharacterized protein n=1 Tax=Albula goreensis TaxID=1534307 RepID=A0A8T3E587_9TELE|nr:hypothetical protein AGOR_G00040600 [Albula goreensis]
MEVLAKAAVAEICELVDDGYAVLHLEISRKQKENEALKKKLHMMEMRLARGSIQKTQAREVTVDIRSSDGVPVFSELTLRGAASVPVDDFPAIDGLFSKQPSINLWRDGETSSVNGVQSPLHSVTRDEAAVMEEEVPESLVIKEERLDEDLESSDSQRGININEDRAVDSDSSERIPILDTQTVPAPGSEELSEQHRTRPGVWDEGGLDAGLKAEPEIKTVNLQDTAGRLNRLGNEVLYTTGLPAMV